MPHIKSYCRFTEDKLYWFFLTSANLSKAAWGAFNKSSKLDPPLRIMNYEAGVLFLPKFIVIRLFIYGSGYQLRILRIFFFFSQNKDSYFSLKRTLVSKEVFSLPYDVPLVRYGPDDTPFLCNL